MNYQKHYELLCERAKNRQFDGYTENHHVIPRCMGGTDESANLVALTPEEHYVAHQLLMKMYPDHSGLEWAASNMTAHPNGKRVNNKLHGWIRRRLQKQAKARTGLKNGSFGTHWYHHPETLEKIRCKPESVPEKFVKGGAPVKPKKEKIKSKGNSKCKVCGKDTKTTYRLYCDNHRKQKRNPSKWNISAKELEKIQMRHLNGESLRKLAEELPISHQTLYKRLKNLGESQILV